MHLKCHRLWCKLSLSPPLCLCVLRIYTAVTVICCRHCHCLHGHLFIDAINLPSLSPSISLPFLRWAMPPNFTMGMYNNCWQFLRCRALSPSPCISSTNACKNLQAIFTIKILTSSLTLPSFCHLGAHSSLSSLPVVERCHPLPFRHVLLLLPCISPKSLKSFLDVPGTVKSMIFVILQSSSSSYLPTNDAREKIWNENRCSACLTVRVNVLIPFLRYINL